MKIPNSPDGDLFDILEESTEVKNTLIDDSPKPDITDFAPVVVESETETKTEAPEPENKPLTRSQCNKNAESIVELVDGVGGMILPSVYKKQKFGTVAKFEEAKSLWRSSRTPNFSPTPDEQILIDKYVDFIDYKDELPLTDPEKETIAKPLGEVLFKHQKEASPEVMLMIAVASVYMPKVIPLIFK